MASFLNQLKEKHKKSGLFSSDAVSISYPMGFPLLDQLLGAVYIRTMEDGTITKDGTVTYN